MYYHLGGFSFKKYVNEEIFRTKQRCASLDLCADSLLRFFNLKASLPEFKKLKKKQISKLIKTIITIKNHLHIIYKDQFNFYLLN